MHEKRDMPQNPQASINNPLSYQTRSRTAPATSPASVAAGAILLSLGALLVVGGTCLSGVLLALQSVLGDGGLAGISMYNWLFIALVYFVPVLTGAIELCCGAQILKGSRVAALIALPTLLVQAVIIIFDGSLYQSRAPDQFQPVLILTMAFFSILTVDLVSFLLALVFLGQRHPTSVAQREHES
jgi:hypothetical protein